VWTRKGRAAAIADGRSADDFSVVAADTAPPDNAPDDTVAADAAPPDALVDTSPDALVEDLGSDSIPPVVDP